MLNTWQKITRVLPRKPFGDGKDGDANLSGTFDPGFIGGVNGSAGSKTLTVGGSGLQNGDLILIHQTRGTGAGQWEINMIESGGGTTTLTLKEPLQYTYTDGGNNQAQVVRLRRYNNVNITSNLTTVGWNGDIGGILPLVVRGTLTIDGEVSVDGKGYRGGSADTRTGGWGGYGGEGVMGYSGRGGWNGSNRNGVSPSGGGQGTKDSGWGYGAAGAQYYTGGGGGGGNDGSEGDESAGGGGGGGHYFGGGGGGSGNDGNNPGGLSGDSNGFGGGGGGGGVRANGGSSGSSGGGYSGGAGGADGYSGEGGDGNQGLNCTGGGGGGGANYQSSQLKYGHILVFGGGGGAGGNFLPAGSSGIGSSGGNGAGIIVIFARRMVVNGYIYAKGKQAANPSGSPGGFGGNGASSNILIVGEEASIGTNRLDAGKTPLNPNVGVWRGGGGGYGSPGVITIYYGKSLSGSVSSSYYGSYWTEQDSDLIEKVGGGAFLYNLL